MRCKRDLKERNLCSQAYAYALPGFGSHPLRPATPPPLATVTLAWNANPETNIGGYFWLRHAPGSYSGSVDVGNTTSRSIASLTSGTRYYFAVRAYNTSGVSGPLSSEVNELASDAPPPPPPPPPPVLLAAAYQLRRSQRLDGERQDLEQQSRRAGRRRDAHHSAGRFGGALAFNGIGGIVTIPSTASLNLTSPFTIEAWVLPSASGGFRTVVMKESAAGGHTYVLYSDAGTTGPSAHVQTTSDRAATGGTRSR